MELQVSLFDGYVTLKYASKIYFEYDTEIQQNFKKILKMKRKKWQEI